MRTSIFLTAILLLAGCDAEKTAAFKTPPVSTPAATAPVVLTEAGKPAVLKCSVDAPASRAIYSAKAPLIISGWAFNDQAINSENKVEILIASAERKEIKTVSAMLGGKRPDVAAYMKKPKAELSGFSTEIPGATFPPGSYNITVSLNSDGSKITCAQTNVVILTD